MESQQMRITFVLPDANMSGGVKVVGIYARELTRMGHLVRLVSLPPKQASFRQKLYRWLRRGDWLIEAARQPSHLENAGLDHRVLDRWKPIGDHDIPDADIVIATWWETAEWVNAVSPQKGAKVYFIQHHEVFPYLPVARCQATYRLPMHKIVVSQWLKDTMSLKYDDTFVDLVPNCVDRAQFFAPERKKQCTPTVGFLYAHASFKGVDISIAALKALRETLPELRIVCFGSVRPDNELALPDGTKFFFSPPQDQIREIYSNCDVWLTASSSEGFNLPAMEAMACRTPVVSTCTGWPAEAVKSRWNGILVEINDTGALAKGLEWVLTRDDEQWERLSANAYATVASSSWEDSAAMFELALKNACRRAAHNQIAGRCGCN